MGKVLHASYSGYFPFCLLPYPGGYVNHTTATLEVAMHSFWVLKRFSISGTYLDGFSATQNFNIVLKTTANSESELVCDKDWEVESSSNLDVITGNWYSSGANFYKDGDLIVPNYEIYALYSGGLGAGLAITSLDASGYLDTYSFQGMTFYGTMESGASSFSMNPLEYWSYDGTFDTSTGALLT